MATQQRRARFGENLYEVKTPTATLYLTADSITVREGVLMLAAEVEENPADADNPGPIELPPAAIFAPGQWLSCVMVTWGDHEVLFSEAFHDKIIEENPDEDEEEGEEKSEDHNN